jgi:transposase
VEADRAVAAARRKAVHRVDDRRVISGIMHMLRSGARWRDCPDIYGPYTTARRPVSDRAAR